MAEIINGKLVSQAKREELKNRVLKLNEDGIEVGLAVIIVGNNSASRVYVNNKKKGCEEIGVTSFEFALPEETTEAELLSLINELNNDNRVDGILCQLPLPKHIDEKVILNRESKLSHMHLHDAQDKKDHMTLGTGDINVDSCSFVMLDVASDVGEIEVDSNMDISGYMLDLKTDIGEVEIGTETYGKKYFHAGKNGSITARGSVGDISINES